MVYYGGQGTARYASEKANERSITSDLANNISQMLLMRIIEMQMNSSDDDKKPKVF